MYAIIESGGKQYKVSEGDIVSVELLPVEPDAAMEITKVLALENEGKLTVGSPYIEGAKVECKVIAHGKGKKVIIFHYKAKKNIRKKNGHRQPFTKLQIEKIVG